MMAFSGLVLGSLELEEELDIREDEFREGVWSPEFGDIRTDVHLDDMEMLLIPGDVVDGDLLEEDPERAKRIFDDFYDKMTVLSQEYRFNVVSVPGDQDCQFYSGISMEPIISGLWNVYYPQEAIMTFERSEENDVTVLGRGHIDYDAKREWDGLADSWWEEDHTLIPGDYHVFVNHSPEGKEESEAFEKGIEKHNPDLAVTNHSEATTTGFYRNEDSTALFSPARRKAISFEIDEYGVDFREIF